MSNEANADCIKCGAASPEHSYTFIAVNTASSSTTSYKGAKRITTTVTTESVAGTEQCCLCEKCIKSKRMSNAVGLGFLSLLGSAVFFTILAAWFINKDYFNKNAGVIILIILGLSAVIGAVSFAASLKKEDAIVASWILAKMRKTKGIVYVPVDRSLYIDQAKGLPTFEKFKAKTGLKTAVAEKLFLTICGSKGDAAALMQILAALAENVPEATEQEKK